MTYEKNNSCNYYLFFFENGFKGSLGISGNNASVDNENRLR